MNNPDFYGIVIYYKEYPYFLVDTMPVAQSVLPGVYTLRVPLEQYQGIMAELQKNKVTILGIIRYTSFSYMVEMSRMVATDIQGGLD